MGPLKDKEAWLTGILTSFLRSFLCTIDSAWTVDGGWFGSPEPALQVPGEGKDERKLSGCCMVTLSGAATKVDGKGKGFQAAQAKFLLLQVTAADRLGWRPLFKPHHAAQEGKTRGYK